MKVEIQEHKHSRSDTEYSVAIREGMEEPLEFFMCVLTAPGTTEPEAILAKKVYDFFLENAPDAEEIIRQADREANG